MSTGVAHAGQNPPLGALFILRNQEGIQVNDGKE
jgi:hypothetical protein